MKTDPDDSASPIQGYCCDASGAISGTYVSAPGMTKRELLALEFAKVRLAANLASGLKSIKMESALSDADALIAALNEEAQ